MISILLIFFPFDSTLNQSRVIWSWLWFNNLSQRYPNLRSVILVLFFSTISQSLCSSVSDFYRGLMKSPWARGSEASVLMDYGIAPRPSLADRLYWLGGWACNLLYNYCIKASVPRPHWHLSSDQCGDNFRNE